MKTLSTPLQAFNAPGTLISYLRNTEANLDAKDHLLSELVTLAQSPRHRELATTLLWLGLWPGLDAVFNRRLKHFRRSPEDLVSLLGEAFTSLVARLDLRSVRRVAATLVRSTERELMTARRRDWDEESKRATEAEIDRHQHEQLLQDRNLTERLEERLGLRPGRNCTEALSRLRLWLAPLVGEDADLLLCVLVLGESQSEAAERFGLTHEASRKRVQRALCTIRNHLDDPVSHSASQTRVCSTPGQRGSGGVER